MHETFPFWFRPVLMLVTPICLVLLATQINAANSDLLDTFDKIKPELEQNVYGIPVYVVSNAENKTMLGEVYGILNYPFQDVRQALGTPENWCDIVPQHLNIKACTYQHHDGYCELTFYTGRKYYENPEDVYKISYRYMRSDSKDDYFHVNLTADSGPMGTKEYRIEVEAIPLDDFRTFIHFSYTYKYNFLTKLGMQTYLATLGSNKVGFSVTGKDEQGNPVFIDGMRGIIERNAVRYFLTIKSYLGTVRVSEDKRFNARIGAWFDLTEKHHQQLYEMDKDDYLEYKFLERKDQIRLQSIVDNSVANKKCAPR